MDKVTSSRRNFIKTTAALAAAGPFINARKARKPNLLFLWTDEQRADTLAVHGNPIIQAPNLNNLASESFVFENAYVSQPVCTPSRSTVMTGLWPHTSGCVENNIPLPRNTPCLPEILNDAEHRTGYFGKWHLGDEIFAQHGFEERESTEDGYKTYFSEGRDKKQTSSYCQFLKELGYKPNSADGTFSRGFCVRLPIDHCKPKFLEIKTCSFLERHRNEPFILYVNYLEPHMPFFGPLNDKYDPDKVILPANFDDPLEEDEPLRYRRLREQYINKGFDGHDLTTESGWRRLIANYCGLVTQVDLSIGAILTKLGQLGLADNTIVVFTSDHGDMMGSHKLLAKSVMYEEAVKVPWLMRVPQSGRKQRILRGRFSHIDLVPTLLDLMGKPMPGAFPGQSLVPLMKGESVREDHVYVEWNHAPRRVKKKNAKSKDEMPVSVDSSNDYVRTVITPDGWKLCLNDTDKCQLFNLRDDPGETTNLFYSGRHKDIIRTLTDRIHAWQKRVGDTISVAANVNRKP